MAAFEVSTEALKVCGGQRGFNALDARRRPRPGGLAVGC